MSVKKVLEDKESVLIEFLQKTKNGDYAPVDPESSKYARIKFLTEIFEQDYYYGWN